jgi:hypothetical protein
MSRENVEIVRAAYDAYNRGGLRGAGVHGYPTGIAARCPVRCPIGTPTSGGNGLSKPFLEDVDGGVDDDPHHVHEVPVDPRHLDPQMLLRL